jgi:protein SCO1
MRRGLTLLCLALCLGACAPQGDWRLKNITGLTPDLEFSMTDDSGQPVSAATYRGKAVLLFFGYTHCPDVCPTTLARLSAAIGALPAHRDEVRVLFVTVDPKRDSAALLGNYARAFGPWVTGLRGSAPQLDALTRRYRVSYALGEPDASGNYEVTHSGGVFVFDRGGRARLLARPDDPAPAITADLQRLLAGD